MTCFWKDLGFELKVAWNELLDQEIYTQGQTFMVEVLSCSRTVWVICEAQIRISNLATANSFVDCADA